MEFCKQNWHVDVRGGKMSQVDRCIFNHTNTNNEPVHPKNCNK